MAKFCPECGNPVLPTSKFCPECGFKLADAQVQSLEEEIGDSTIDAGCEPAVKEEMPESSRTDTSQGADEEMGEYRSESTDEETDECPLEDAGEAASEHTDEAVSEDSCEETVEAEDSLEESMLDYGEAASAGTDSIAPDELEAQVCLEDTVADDATETEDLTDEKAGSRKPKSRKKLKIIVVVAIVLVLLIAATASDGDTDEDSDRINAEAILGETQTLEQDGFSVEIPIDWSVENLDNVIEAISDDESMTALFYETYDASIYNNESVNLTDFLDVFGAGGVVKHYQIESAEIYRFYIPSSSESIVKGYVQIALSGESLSCFVAITPEDNWDENYEFLQAILDTMSITDPSEPVYSYEELTGGSDGSEDESSSTDGDEAEETSEIVSTLQTFDLFEETTVTGYGDDVVDVPVDGVPMLMTITNSGSSNFVVWSIDENGEDVDLLVNEIGSYSGTVTTFLYYEDVSMVEVQSSGSWSITFTPMGSMEELENGKEYTGDGVYYIDADSLTKITASNSGDSNFVIWGIGMDDVDLLVNEIGDYSGTVVWAQPQSFLIVSSDGTWSVSW